LIIYPLVAIVLAGLMAGALAFPTALIVFRLRGAYFAIGTWVVAEVYRLVFAQFRHSAVARARRPLAIVAMLFASKGIWGFLSDRGAPAVFPLRRSARRVTPAAPHARNSSATTPRIHLLAGS
jgi:hypothetical protein